MSAKQARDVKRWKAMVRMYCHRDGTHPGPVIPLSLTFRNVYKAFRLDLLPLTTPLLGCFKAAQISPPLLWGGATAYFDIKQKEVGV